MKIYNKQIIKNIQHCIKNANIKMKVLNDYSFFETNKITCGEITLHFYYNKEADKREVEYIISNSDVNAIYIKDWKTSAPGKFLMKDYKNDVRDIMNNNTPYYEINFTTHDKNYKGLVRLLIEVSDTTISEEDKNVLINNYGDLMIDDRYFSIIKLNDDDGLNLWNTKEKLKLLETTFESDNKISSIIDNTDIITSADSEEQEEEQLSDPLF